MDFENLSPYCLLVFVIVIIIVVVLDTEFLYNVLADLLPPPQKLYARAHGSAADPCDHKPLSAEYSGDNGAEAV